MMPPPAHADMTVQEAADFLNVSLSYLLTLLDEGTIPCQKAASHVRIRFADLKGYKDRIAVERAIALDELAAVSQELGMGY